MLEIEGIAIDSEDTRVEIDADGRIKLDGTATDDDASRLGTVRDVDSVTETDESLSDVDKARLEIDALKVGAGTDDDRSVKIEVTAIEGSKLRLNDGINVGSRLRVGTSIDIEGISIVDGRKMLDTLGIGREIDDKISIEIEGITDDDKSKLAEGLSVGSRLDTENSTEIEENALGVGNEKEQRTSTEEERDTSELEAGSDDSVVEDSFTVEDSCVIEEVRRMFDGVDGSSEEIGTLDDS